MKTNNEKKKQDELMKQVMEEQMRLHPEIYEKKKDETGKQCWSHFFVIFTMLNSVIWRSIQKKTH